MNELPIHKVVHEIESETITTHDGFEVKRTPGVSIEVTWREDDFDDALLALQNGYTDAIDKMIALHDNWGA